jgi:DNA-binding YbaB/EbfC family protein
MTMPNLEEIMAMAQNLQNEMQKATENLDKIEVEGVAGGGMVVIRATAKGRVLGVEISETLLQPLEKTMLEDLVAAAFNDAKAKADAAAAEEINKMSSALPMPPGFKLPF